MIVENDAVSVDQIICTLGWSKKKIYIEKICLLQAFQVRNSEKQKNSSFNLIKVKI
jgi:hypothetical protein